MSALVHLRLERSDLWRRHGLMNVAMCIVAIVCLLGVTATCIGLMLRGQLHLEWQLAGSITFMVVVLLLFLWTHQGVLRSFLALFSDRPYLEVSESGISIDGGLTDRWFLPWTDIAAMAPPAKSIQRDLSKGEHVAITFRLHKEPSRRCLSDIQHSKLRDHLELGGYFQRPLDADLDRLHQYLSNVKEQQPFLISDWE